MTTVFSEALDMTLKEFKITGRWLSGQSGVSEQAISKYRLGQKDIEVGTYEKLIMALPSEARNYLFFKVLIKDSSTEDLSLFLHAIAQAMRGDTTSKQLEPELALAG
ncbi:MAG: hypothetical protein HC818_00090 [Synechococcaceae cyanobacterium RM1_1_27]|nr:hypothetical protein [Synechococcaceae cyanobacterium RM1_1_27]